MTSLPVSSKSPGSELLDPRIGEVSSSSGVSSALDGEMLLLLTEQDPCRGLIRPWSLPHRLGESILLLPGDTPERPMEVEAP